MTASFGICVIRSSLVDWWSMKKECRHARHTRVRRFRLKFFSAQSEKISLTFFAFRMKTKMSGAPYTQRIVRIAFAGSVSSLTFVFTRILCIFREMFYTVFLLDPFCAAFPLLILHIFHIFNNIIIIYMGTFFKFAAINRISAEYVWTRSDEK